MQFAGDIVGASGSLQMLRLELTQPFHHIGNGTSCIGILGSGGGLRLRIWQCSACLFNEPVKGILIQSPISNPDKVFVDSHALTPHLITSPICCPEL